MKYLLRRPTLLSTGLICLFAFPFVAWNQNLSPQPSSIQTNSSQRRPSRNTPGGKSVSRAADGVVIPGPLRSFLRMAGISQKVPTEDVLPLLSRNVFMQGYSRDKPTEFLILLDRYVQQA